MTNETKRAKSFTAPTPEEISTYAYYLWEADGRQHGCDMDHWLQAKAHLIADRQYESGVLQAPPPRTAAQKSALAQAAAAGESNVAKTGKKKKSEVQRSHAAAPRQPAFA